mgnify:CR=1 FL=1
MTASNRRKPQRSGGTPREQAMALLAEGISIAEVARRLGLHRRTVEKWRGTPAGAAALETAKEQAREAFQSTVEAARSKLSAAADEATDAVLEVLRSAKSGPQDRLRAASMIFDRVGLPRTQRIEQEAATEDTSALTDEELAAYEAAKRKIHRASE